jgi:hypothetical protein
MKYLIAIFSLPFCVLFGIFVTIILMVEKGIETITKIFNAWIDIFIKNT